MKNKTTIFSNYGLKMIINILKNIKTQNKILPSTVKVVTKKWERVNSSHQSIIDKWICKETNGMVTKVQPLPAIYIDVMVNVIYMKDKWKH